MGQQSPSEWWEEAFIGLTEQLTLASEAAFIGLTEQLEQRAALCLEQRAAEQRGEQGS